MSKFKVATLASGSKGNATIIKCGKEKILVDIGISCRDLTNRLKSINMTPEELTGIFITHEHDDHIKGLKNFSKKYEVPVFASKGTWQGLQDITEEVSIDMRVINTTIALDKFEITPFKVSHDANEPIGFTVKSNKHKLSYVTDTGTVSEQIKKVVLDSDVVVLEANHDIDMLMEGSYPAFLKKRILGTKGHLANTQAAWLLAQLPLLPKEIFLIHLSQDNNNQDVALETIQTILNKQQDISKIKFYIASQKDVITNF